MDRIINPDGLKMVNVNIASQEDILVALKSGLSEVYTGDVNALAGQINREPHGLPRR